jgi:hypothetical protein
MTEEPFHNSNHSGNTPVGVVAGGRGIVDREDCRYRAKCFEAAGGLGGFYFLDEHSKRGAADSNWHVSSEGRETEGGVLVGEKVNSRWSKSPGGEDSSISL